MVLFDELYQWFSNGAMGHWTKKSFLDLDEYWKKIPSNCGEDRFFSLSSVKVWGKIPSIYCEDLCFFFLQSVCHWDKKF